MFLISWLLLTWLWDVLKGALEVTDVGCTGIWETSPPLISVSEPSPICASFGPSLHAMRVHSAPRVTNTGRALGQVLASSSMVWLAAALDPPTHFQLWRKPGRDLAT